MKFPSSFFFSLLGIGSTWAQSTAPSFVQLDVPTGTPVSGDYRGALRPQVHLSPPKGFMNDPNGLFRDSDGIYHVYYQYNPTATTLGNQHWGHATSRDGYTFTNQPIALFPLNSNTFPYSGSIVIDEANTSGFFPHQNNGVVAILTLHNSSSETQALAFSRDGGYTFEYYKGNPVIDAKSTSFRDPKVFWHASTRKWVMAVAFSLEHKVAIYTSSDLKSWSHVSEFGNTGLLGLQWECPNLVEVPVEASTSTMWLLTVGITAGASANGGSTTQYFPGFFDGTTFTAVDSIIRTVDFADEAYAGQFFYGIPKGEKPLSMSFLGNALYALSTPSGPQEGWRTVMTTLREISLQQLPSSNWTLVSRPHNIRSQLSKQLLDIPAVGNSGVTVDYSSIQSGAIWFEANITGPLSDVINGAINFDFTSSKSGESITGSTIVNGATTISRANTRGLISPFYSPSFATYNTYKAKGQWSISGLVDRTMAEVFVNNGIQNGNMIYFPTSPLDTMHLSGLFLPKGVTLSVSVWGVKDQWESQQSADGLVLGNTTASS